MPDGERGQIPVNTRKIREAVSQEAKARAEFSGAVKKGARTIACMAGDGAGTTLANIAIPLGCGPLAPVPSLFAHGGARNCAGRTSEGLALDKVRALIAAARRASAIGRPFNRFITVHWQTAGLTEAEAMPATTALLKYWREWLGGHTAYIWTRENGGGKGSHLHILAHLPEGREINGRRSIHWIERITGQPYRRGVILTKKIAGAGQPDGAIYAENLGTVLAYVLKGAEPDAAAAIGIEHKHGGRIIGKRCGISQNIACKARSNRLRHVKK